MRKIKRMDMWRLACARIPASAAAALCVLAAVFAWIQDEPASIAASVQADLPSDAPLIALTFDDGPYAGVTSSILDTLEEHGVTATFFVLGSRIEGREDTLIRMEALGCEVGNHGWSHTDLTLLSGERIVSEIARANAEFERVLGHPAAVVRPPYGHYNSTVRILIPCPLVLWTVDTGDWQKQNPQSLAEYVIREAQSGCVVLMHDQQRSTAEAMGIIIPRLIEAGFRFVTVSELIEATGGECSAIKLPE